MARDHDVAALLQVDEPDIGVCPACIVPIPESRLLIEYETADGPAVFAECPRCRDVVHPMA